MIFDWLKNRKKETPTLTAIYIATSAGKAMQSTDTIEAIRDRGLKGDRYCEDAGYWKSIEACQVTLISEHDLRQAKKGVDEPLQVKIDAGEHRRNLVVAGIRTNKLEGKMFRIGEATFKYEKNRPPCGYIDKVAGKGMCKSLGHNSGACIKVLTGGVLSVGDVVEIIQPVS